jgi:hypothetical protein
METNTTISRKILAHKSIVLNSNKTIFGKPLEKTMADLAVQAPPKKRCKTSHKGSSSTKNGGFSMIIGHADVWVDKILPFIGPGSFFFVAMVNKRMRDLYKIYFASLQESDIPLEEWSKTRISDYHTTDRAILFNASCLKFAHENGCPFIWYYSGNWCAVARAGQLDVLKHAHEHGAQFLWNERACSEAARAGQLDVLKYAHEHGSRWDSQTCANAVKGGHLEILKYALEHGCPCGVDAWLNAEESGCSKTLQYLRRNWLPGYRKTINRPGAQGNY